MGGSGEERVVIKGKRSHIGALQEPAVLEKEDST